MDLSAQSKARLDQADIHQQWESDYLNPEMDRFYDLAFGRILRSLGDVRGKTILEVGCGYCYHTRRLARSELSITAVDFSLPALEAAERTLSESGLSGKVNLQQADATALPFEDESFDHVLIWGVLMHIPEVEKALREAARVLKPAGKLVISETNARSPEVVFLEPAIESIRRIIGKSPRTRKKTALGIEEWQPAERGALLVRKANIQALTSFCDDIMLRLDERFAGEFTQIYPRLPGKLLKRIAYAFNRAYFKHVGAPGPALSNILIFEKIAARPM